MPEPHLKGIFIVRTGTFTLTAMTPVPRRFDLHVVLAVCLKLAYARQFLRTADIALVNGSDAICGGHLRSSFPIGKAG